MTQRLTDLEITRVSLVDKGANARRLAVLKRDEEGSMTDPADAPAGVIAWLRKALGIDSAPVDSAPVVKSAMPTTDAAMRSHLAAKTPGGHGMGDIAVANMSMAAMTKRHTADSGADHSHTVAKTATFAEVVAGQELRDALSDSWYTLDDALRSAIYGYDENGQPLSVEAKKALVGQNLDEFRAYLLAQMDSGISKRDGGPAEAAARHIAAVVAKAGKKISGDRLVRLNAAAEALNSVLAEVADVVASEAADTAKEIEVDKAEMVAAFTEAIEPIAKRIEALEAKPGVKGEAAASEGGEDPVTLETVVAVVEKLADRLAAVEGSGGVRKSLAGQDGGVEVKKASVFAGIM